MRRRDLLRYSATAGALGALAPIGMPGFAVRDAQAQGAGAAALRWGGNLSRTLDPHTVYDVPSAFTRVNLYDCLYEYAGNPPEPKPLLATETRSSADGKTHDFTIRAGVKFHDGSELTAEDVVYSFRRMLALPQGVGPAFRPFMKAEGVTATGRHSVRMELQFPYAPFFACLPMVAIMNKRLMEANTVNNDWAAAWVAGNDAGSGPYKVVPGSFRPLDSLDMEAVDGYWRGWPHSRPIRQVLCRPVRDDATRLLAVEKGDIDSTHSYIRPDQHERVRRAPGLRLVEEPQLRTYLLRVHNGRDPMNNLDFRKALSYAFPYELFIQRVLRGTAVRSPGPLPVSLWGHPRDLQGYKHDLDAARRHLDAARRAGANVTREITFTALVGFDETEQAAQLLQSELRKIGVTMRIAKAVWANAVQMTQREETSPDIWSHWGSTYYIDPDNWVGQFYSKAALGTQRGSSWYRDDETDGMLAAARATLDRAERQRLYEAASRRLVDQAVDVWIYNGMAYRAVRERVKGYRPGAVGDGLDLRELWLEG
ncbi:MAG: ABC transporter substrate-binding protein [Alphaproteobacteria bacterium]|nr:ABC transporter substrate-binding protein [Alphaproteobacteria bacterium]